MDVREKLRLKLFNLMKALAMAKMKDIDGKETLTKEDILHA